MYLSLGISCRCNWKGQAKRQDRIREDLAQAQGHDLPTVDQRIGENVFFSVDFLYLFLKCHTLSSIYLVHDDIKDKHFLLEMSWVTLGMKFLKVPCYKIAIFILLDTNMRHEFVPHDVLSEAESFAKAALEEADADA